MRNAAFFLGFFLFSFQSASAQDLTGDVNRIDSAQIYFFNLFDDKRTMNWGTVPKNFPFVNYRVYLKNNSNDTLRLGKMTTGDGRVSYRYDGHTKLIYPGEYLVFEPFCSVQIRDRFGGFSKTLTIAANTNDTLYRFIHRYKGFFSTDTLYPAYDRIPVDVSLRPKRKQVELDADDAYRRESERKIAANQRKKEGGTTLDAATNISSGWYHFYVQHSDSLLETRREVYMRSKWRCYAMDTVDGTHTSFKFLNYENDASVRVQLHWMNGSEMLSKEVEMNRGTFIFVDFDGENHYFDSQDACEQYIERRRSKRR